MAKVTGIGGVFLRCADPKALSEWYQRVLGFSVEDWGGALFRSDDERPPQVVWAPFELDTSYFAPSGRDFMINFAVDDLDAMVARLAEQGVQILGREDGDSNGRFAWFLDPADIKVELWEPKI